MQTKSKKQSSSKDLEFWSKCIREWETSGLSKMAFCRQKGLSRHAFYYWQKKLTAEAALDSDHKVVALPFKVQDFRESKPISLKLGQKFQLDIQGDFSPRVLQKLIKTLENML